LKQFGMHYNSNLM